MQASRPDRQEEEKEFPKSPCCSQLDLSELGEVLQYNPKFREYTIPVRDGGTSGIVLNFCPWCGTELPSSLRDEWFDRLAERLIDPVTDEIPPEFQTDKWWREDIC